MHCQPPPCNYLTLSPHSMTEQTNNVSPGVTQPLSPAELRNLRIVKAIAGSRTSFLIDNYGRVYTCGYNGENGRGRTGSRSTPTSGFVKSLTQIQFPPPPSLQEGMRHAPVRIRDIASYTHSLFITDNGELYVAGDNEMGGELNMYMKNGTPSG